jgi:hypothetical protein
LARFRYQEFPGHEGLLARPSMRTSDSQYRAKESKGEGPPSGDDRAKQVNFTPERDQKQEADAICNRNKRVLRRRLRQRDFLWNLRSPR